MYGITSDGFVIKPLQVIKTELETEFRNTFGNDIDLDADSPFGQLVGNTAKKEAALWELAQAIYNAFSPDKAEDVSLDGAVALVGITRLAATQSRVVVALYGTLGTVIPTGHLIRQDETNEDFELAEAVTIGTSSLIDCVVSVLNVLNNQLYTVTINGNAYTYTSDGTATALEIIAGLKADIDSGDDPVEVIDNLDGSMQIVGEDSLSFSLTVDVNLQIDSQASPGIYLAVNFGVIPVPAGTLDIIVNPIAGLNNINNIEAGTTGTDVETDEALRVRRRNLLTGIGAATDEAIRAAVLQEIDGVSACVVISNRTLSTISGRPPKSFETVVAGGDEDEIAEKIWLNMPSGIEPHGSITKTVIDSAGNSQTIKFSRPTNIYIWVEVDYELNSEEDFPPDGEVAIKTAIVAYGQTNFGIGKDVIRQRLATAIYTVDGIGDIVIRLGSETTPATPPGSFTENNIIIADNEVSIWDETQIEVTQV